MADALRVYGMKRLVSDPYGLIRKKIQVPVTLLENKRILFGYGFNIKKEDVHILIDNNYIIVLR